jgi:hypothetical protein
MFKTKYRIIEIKETGRRGYYRIESTVFGIKWDIEMVPDTNHPLYFNTSVEAAEYIDRLRKVKPVPKETIIWTE